MCRAIARSCSRCDADQNIEYPVRKPYVKTLCLDAAQRCSHEDQTLFESMINGDTSHARSCSSMLK